MEIIKYPSRNEWRKIIERPHLDTLALHEKVSNILNDIRENGDSRIRSYVEQFQGVRLSDLEVSEKEFTKAETLIDPKLKDAILTAKENIAKFHSSQAITPQKIETSPGVTCWQKAVGIERVGLYIPGGTAPLFSTVLMLAVPARIAGCREIIMCSPCDTNGNVHPAILFAARTAGIDRVFKLGGVQAIGAMAYGTESIPKVYKIFGPGNQYVTAAKQIVSLKDVAIDMPAGPSEVEVIADSSSSPEFVASDFLSQAEHGADSQSILLTTEESVIEKVKKEIEYQLERLPRKELTQKSLEHSRLILLKNWNDVIDLTNDYAPEHLIIQSSNYRELSEHIINAGSVFLGPYTPESAGDYASGTNHTLPTSGYARAYSGVNLDSFIRKITFQEITREGLQNLGNTIETMAANEMLDAHKNAVSVRLAKINQ
ncbi:histidinol dehydrogenase [Coprobacter sp.]